MIVRSRAALGPVRMTVPFTPTSPLGRSHAILAARGPLKTKSSCRPLAAYVRGSTAVRRLARSLRSVIRRKSELSCQTPTGSRPPSGAGIRTARATAYQMALRHALRSRSGPVGTGTRVAPAGVTPRHVSACSRGADGQSARPPSDVSQRTPRACCTKPAAWETGGGRRPNAQIRAGGRWTSPRPRMARHTTTRHVVNRGGR